MQIDAEIKDNARRQARCQVGSVRGAQNSETRPLTTRSEAGMDSRRGVMEMDSCTGMMMLVRRARRGEI